MIDLSMINRSIKRKALFSKDKIRYTKLFSLAEFMQFINEEFGVHIERHQGLRQIIDVQFRTTNRIYLMNFMIMLFGFDLPFIW